MTVDQNRSVECVVMVRPMKHTEKNVTYEVRVLMEVLVHEMIVRVLESVVPLTTKSVHHSVVLLCVEML